MDCRPMSSHLDEFFTCQKEEHAQIELTNGIPPAVFSVLLKNA